jgi:hypothetical protein
MSFLDKISYPMILLGVVFLGFAPFFPEPHIWQKINLLIAGGLNQALDIFDLLYHGSPFILLGLKVYRDTTKNEK